MGQEPTLKWVPTLVRLGTTSARLLCPGAAEGMLRRRRASLVEPELHASAQNTASLGEQGGGIFVSERPPQSSHEGGKCSRYSQRAGGGQKDNQEREAQECCLLRKPPDYWRVCEPATAGAEGRGEAGWRRCRESFFPTLASSRLCRRPVSTALLSQPPMNRPTQLK